MALRPAYARRSASHGMPRRRSLLAALLAIGIAVTGLALGSAPAVADEVVPPVASLEIEVTDCEQYGGQGVLHYVVRDPYDYYQDFITVYDAADQIVHEAVYLDGTVFEADVSLAPGEYTIVYTVERETGGANIDRQEFTIGACPDVDVEIVAATCSLADSGSFTLVLSGLVPGETYRWEAAGHFGTFVADGESLEIFLVEITPGNHLAYVEWQGDGLMFDWRGFAIEPCQPVLATTVTQCTAAGGSAAVHVALSKLVHGVVYTVTGPDGSTQQATAQPSDVTNLTFASQKPGTTGTVSVEGIWSVDHPWEEPPFIGGGDFVPLETVVLAAQADVTLDPCPASTPAKPAAKTTATLPAAGIDGIGPTILGAVAALAIGGLLLGAARRRSRGNVAD